MKSLLKSLVVGLIMSLGIMTAVTAQTSRQIVSPFFAFENGSMTSQQVKADAGLLKKLGYAGMGYVGMEGLPEALSIVQKEGMKIYASLLTLDVEQGIPAQWREIFPRLKGSGLVLCVKVVSDTPLTGQSVDAKAVPVLGQLADLAASCGVRVALMQDKTSCLANADDAIRVANAVARENLGLAFNLPQLLATEHMENIDRVITAMMPKLYVCVVAGADWGENPEAMSWNQLVQPLDKGTFEVYRVVEILAEKGYTGPVGLLSGENAQTTLAGSIQAWNEFKRRYAVPLNTLSAQEQKEGWELLFDGRGVELWRGINVDHFPEAGWYVKDQSLVADVAGGGESSRAGDIITRKKYGKFILTWEWNMKTKGGNSGVKYYVMEGLSSNPKYGYGLEYQLLDDRNFSWMFNGKMKPNDYRTLGGLYEMYAASPDKKPSPLCLWNESKIVSDGDHVEHWLNGQLILEYKRSDPDFRQKIAESKFKDVPGYGIIDEGFILLQDHGSKILYRNLKIKELK